MGYLTNVSLGSEGIETTQKWVKKRFIQGMKFNVWVEQIAWFLFTHRWEIRACTRRLELVKRVFLTRLHTNSNFDKVLFMPCQRSVHINWLKLGICAINYCFTLCGDITDLWSSNRDEWSWCASYKNNRPIYTKLQEGKSDTGKIKLQYIQLKELSLVLHSW